MSSTRRSDDLGEGRGRGPERSSRVVRRTRPAPAAARAAGRRPGRSRRPGRGRSRRVDVPDRRSRPAARPSRRPARSAGPVGGSRRRRRARPVRRARSARRPRAGPSAPARTHPWRRRGAAASSPAGRSSGRSPTTVRQPLRAAAATSGASDRSVAATTARVRAGCDRTSSRTRSPAVRRRRGPGARGRSGRPRIRVEERRDGRIRAGRAGQADEPISRQVRPSLPTRATETVAAPRSTVANARGSLVTGACYPSSPVGGRTGIAGREGGRAPVRRPRSSRRRSPRAA